MTNKIELTEKQQRYLVKHFQHTKNQELAQQLGLSERTMIRRAKELGLVKTKNFMNKTAREGLALAKEACERNGYARQREAATAQQRQWREQHPGEPYPGTFKAGVKNVERLGKRKERQRLEKSKATHRETMDRDRRRIRMGLQPLTLVFKEDVSSHEKILLRNYMKRRYRYIPVFRNPNLMYYDRNTERRESLEREAREYGIEIKKIQQHE